MASYRRKFVCRGLTIDASSNQAGDLEWLAENITPHFRLTDSPVSDFTVSLRADDARFRQLDQRGANRGGDTLSVFAFDVKLVHQPVWNGEDDRLIVFDREFRVFYIVDRSRASIEIVARPAKRWARIALFRVVRELAMGHAVHTGDLIMHGAAFAIEDLNFLILGLKNAGKTTLLIHALRDQRTRLISNDRTLVFRQRGEVEMLGLPTIVKVRPGTLGLFPGIGCASRWHLDACDTLSEIESAPAKDADGDDSGPRVLSPSQFCSLLSCESAPGGRLAAIVYPRVQPEAHGLRLQRLGHEEALLDIRNGIFGAARVQSDPSLFASLAGATVLPTTEGPCRKVAGSVPSFRCVMGTNSFDAGASAFIDQLAALVKGMQG